MCYVDAITEYNKRSGICGIVAGICAVYHHDVSFHMKVDQESDPVKIILDQQKKFLDGIKITSLWSETESFTKEFRPSFSLQSAYEAICKGPSSMLAQSGKNVETIAMTPKGVVKLLELNGVNSQMTEKPHDQTYARCILGFGRSGSGSYSDLKHWVYFFNGNMAWNRGSSQNYDAVMKNEGTTLAPYTQVTHKIAIGSH